MALSTKQAVPDETLARTRQISGDQGVVDPTTLAGTYVTAAMLLGMA